MISQNQIFPVGKFNRFHNFLSRRGWIPCLFFGIILFIEIGHLSMTSVDVIWEGRQVVSYALSLTVIPLTLIVMMFSYLSTHEPRTIWEFVGPYWKFIVLFTVGVLIQVVAWWIFFTPFVGFGAGLISGIGFANLFWSGGPFALGALFFEKCMSFLGYHRILQRLKDWCNSMIGQITKNPENCLVLMGLYNLVLYSVLVYVIH